MNSKALYFILISCCLLAFSAQILFAYDENADTAGLPPTTSEISITPREINIKYDDNSDTIIYRLGQSSSGGTAFKEDKPVIAIGEDEVISVSDTVRADIVIMFGNLQVEGYVRGDIKVLIGDIAVLNEGNIEGDIFCLGQVSLDSGVHVWGNIKASELITPSRSSDYDLRGEFREVKFAISDLRVLGPPAMVLMIAILLSVLIIVSIISIIIPKPVARVRYQIEIGFVKNLLVGALIIVALFPLWILLLVTIIGLPIALLVFPFMVAGAIVLGSIGYTQFAGFLLGKYTTLRYSGYLRTTIAGIILLGAPMIFAAFFGFIGFHFLAWPLQMIFVASQIVMICTGMGAVFFSRFGTVPNVIKLKPTFKSRDESAVGLTSEI